MRKRKLRICTYGEHEKNLFLSNMSHEMKTPLNTIMGMLYLMEQDLDNKEKLMDYLKKSEIAAGFLMSLMNNIMDMSKIERKVLSLVVRPVELEGLLYELGEMCRQQALAKGVSFCMKPLLCSESYIMADGSRLQQILINILHNAVKFTSEGGRILFQAEEVSNDNDTVTVRFMTEDTGCGISQDFMDRIWEPFEQENRSKSQNGAGLGMSISYMLTKMMKGSILAESRLGEGSRFTVEIPFGKYHIQNTGAEEKHRSAKEEGEKRHILVAEDNMMNIEILQAILEKNGFAVTKAYNGREAVEKFLQSEPGTFHSILMDIQMPVMNGYEASWEIRSLDRADAGKIRIFACTANLVSGDEGRIYRYGMNGIITKPIDARALVDLLKY